MPDNHNDNVGLRLATHPACPARCRSVTAAVVQDGYANTGRVPAPIPVTLSGEAKESRVALGPVGAALWLLRTSGRGALIPLT
ncbi:MAG: hypothetical protein HC828_10930 [Blastochloris sp.]|nr:hypothetical protein [Blastochloris sp.]